MLQRLDSVIREFEIIGEEKSNLLDEEYRVIIDLRNYIIYKYFGISSERIWDIIYGVIWMNYKISY